MTTASRVSQLKALVCGAALAPPANATFVRVRSATYQVLVQDLSRLAALPKLYADLRLACLALAFAREIRSVRRLSLPPLRLERGRYAFAGDLAVAFEIFNGYTVQVRL